MDGPLNAPPPPQKYIYIFLFEFQHRPHLDVSGLSIVREILPFKMLLGMKLTLSK